MRSLAATIAACCIAAGVARADVHLAAVAGGGLGIVGLDVENDRFWIAVSSPVGGTVYFAATDRSPVDRFYGLDAAVGLRLRVEDSPRLFVVPFATTSYLRRIVDEKDPGTNLEWLAAGVGVGLQSVWSKGVVLQLNLPVAGYAIDRAEHWDGFVPYLLAGLATMPVAVVGYRW